MRAVVALVTVLFSMVLWPGTDPAVESASRIAASDEVARAAGSEAVGPAAGAIRGVVRGARAPQRRVAPRYPGSAGGATRSVQPIDPVVFLRGTVPGAGVEAQDAAPAIAQEDTAFVPSLRVVPVGTTVDFPNRDPFFHNVFSYSPSARFDLGRYPRGESKSVTFREPGVVKVYCEVHDFMRATVVAVENPFHAVPDDEGRFLIEGIPPGTYTLVAWDADRGMIEREVTVADGQTTRVELGF